MSKNSKSCSYTGEQHAMNRVNKNKIDYVAHQSKLHEQNQSFGNNHSQRKNQYPEVAAEMRAQAKCNCKS